MDALVAFEKEPTGPEWFTAEQYAARYRCASSTARLKLKELVGAGRLKEWRGVPAGGRVITRKYSPA